MTDSAANRRDFLTGQAVRDALAPVASTLSGAIPSRGPTVMLRTTAMATDFDVILNPDGPDAQVAVASAALDEVHRLESQLTVYRDDSEVSVLNRTAHERPMTVESNLYGLLQRGRDVHQRTSGAFDHASGALIALWQQSRREQRVPTPGEIEAALAVSGVSHLQFQDDREQLSFDVPGVALNLGAIGKGYAVDQAGNLLDQVGVENWLVHGGKSSVLTRGTHAGYDGWPVGLRNPLFPDRPYLTLLLKDAALSTSGTAVNWFRHAGKRYGHILDPRTGWPVETMLSVSVIAPDAALSDALSTAFFVLGVEKALECCDNFPEVGVILFPLPSDGRTLEPLLHRVPAERVFAAAESGSQVQTR
ncbi:MAG: FAD:protein FMN transferase [Planctomycetaceae bacterium]